MAKLIHRGKYYYVDYRVNGRRVRKSVGTSKAVADTILKDIEVKIAREESGLFLKDVSIEDFSKQIDEYLKLNVRPSTGVRYREALEHFKRFRKDHPHIIRISHITPAVWESYKTSRTKSVKNSTINMELKIWRTFFNLAIRWGYLRLNPISKVEFLPNINRKIPRFYTREEADLIITNTPAPYNDIYLFLLYTGMRRNELRYLESKDVDLGRRRIHIRVKDTFSPKTTERTIPISDPLIPFLQKVLKDRPLGLIFPNYKGKVFDERKWWKVLQKVVEKLEAKGKKIEGATIHTFRHTFASWLVMAGVDLTTIKELLGHSDIRTTMIYSHLAKEHLDKAVNKLQFWHKLGTIQNTKKKPAVSA